MEQWFQEHNGGQWYKYYSPRKGPNFKGVTGAQLCLMRNENFLRRSVNGDLIFNDIAKLKRLCVLPSSSESSPGSAAGAVL